MEVIKINKGQFTRQGILADTILILVKKELSEVLCDTEGLEFELEIGEFENCREYGYTYSLLGGIQDNVFCVYEHRNSDNICINGCKREDVKPYGPYSGESKWDTLGSFSYSEYHAASKQLVEFLVHSFNGAFDTNLFK